MGPHYLEYSTSPPDSKDAAPSRRVLVFFISGNPGLADYYAPFLSTLRDRLASTSSLSATHFHLYAQDLAGFSPDDHAPFTPARPPRDVEFQIQHTLSSLGRLCGDSSDSSYDEVLLIGHSVGAYLALEAMHRALKQASLLPHCRLRSAILLFPTISHMAQSPSGWKLDLLRRTPVLGAHAWRIAQGFLWLWPYGALRGFVRAVLGMPAHAADVTTAWLKSRDGVWQALHLGMDEMQVIGEAKWHDELWDIGHEAQAQAHDDRETPPKFYFFFGRNDHWVADKYRDEFIARRKEQAGQRVVRVEVDESKIPHAFCIQHSEAVAEKVAGWMTEIYGT
ncbi:hypothetical protein F4780DRAFT_571562 [Xylariomycetidae sp. FL0641]|nr:hypothetical protein F4780DRAFT_571562 [Xylariomycetidae sp. FL0641]